MVLTGSDGLAAGIEQKLWVELLPAMADSLPSSTTSCFLRR